MLDQKRIGEIAQDVAVATLAARNVAFVSSRPSVDSEGHPAIRITIVINPGSLSRISGDAVLDTLVGIQERLREEGEDRLPIVEYATEKELNESGDS